jgi:hypothetical protein
LLISGTIAILANMAALALCDLAGVATAHGGLLKLVRMVTGLPSMGTAGQQAFHVLVGLAMALAYGLALEPRLPGKALTKGLIYAALVWIANAALVLPLTGEGFAGHRHITLLGILLFAAAHTLFFALLAVIHARLIARPDPAEGIEHASGRRGWRRKSRVSDRGRSVSRSG